MSGECTHGVVSFRATADSCVIRYTTIPFGIISVLCCLALPNIKKYMTNRVAVVSVRYESERPSDRHMADIDAGHSLEARNGLWKAEEGFLQADSDSGGRFVQFCHSLTEIATLPTSELQQIECFLIESVSGHPGWVRHHNFRVFVSWYTANRVKTHPTPNRSLNVFKTIARLLISSLLDRLARHHQ
jgi:hypothetical protein